MWKNFLFKCLHCQPQRSLQPKPHSLSACFGTALDCRNIINLSVGSKGMKAGYNLQQEHALRNRLECTIRTWFRRSFIEIVFTTRAISSNHLIADYKAIKVNRRMQRSNLHFCKPASINLHAFLGMGIMKTESNTKQISRKKIVKKQDFLF